MRVLGVDFGLRRIGLALSDPTGTLATPLTTVTRRRGKRPPLTRIVALAREYGVERVVMGLPLTLEGEENDWTEEVRRVGTELGRRLGVPVEFQDERLSSVRAEARMREAAGRRAVQERRERVDAAAAALILQDWLDAVR